MRKSGNEETEQSEQERAECVQESGSRVKNSHLTQRWHTLDTAECSVYKRKGVQGQIALKKKAL